MNWSRRLARSATPPSASVNFVDAQRQWFKAVRGLDLRETPRDVSICTHAILGRDLLVVPDTFEDMRFRDSPLLIGEPQLRFYAGALLKTREGLPLGTVCVLDHKPRPEGLSYGQERALKALAQAAMRLVEMRMAGDRIRASESSLSRDCRQDAADGVVGGCARVPRLRQSTCGGERGSAR